MDDVPGPHSTWPLPVPTSKAAERISTDLLSPEQKVILWRHLEANHPEYAGFLRQSANDPRLAGLLEEPGAGFLIAKQYVPDALRFLLDKGK